MQFSFSSDLPAALLGVAIYDDQDDSWPRVYKSSMPCSDKLIFSKNWDNATKTLIDSFRFNLPGNGATVDLIRDEIIQRARPRFWYVVLVGCTQLPLETRFRNIGYRVTMLNVRATNWNIQFGVNEQGLNTLYLLYFWIYLILFFSPSIWS